MRIRRFSGIRTTRLRLLSKRAGVGTCRADVHAAIDALVRDFVQAIVHDACAISNMQGRRTVDVTAVHYALERRGRAAYT